MDCLQVSYAEKYHIKIVIFVTATPLINNTPLGLSSAREKFPEEALSGFRTPIHNCEFRQHYDLARIPHFKPKIMNSVNIMTLPRFHKIYCGFVNIMTLLL